MLRERHQFFVLLLALADGLTAAVACALAWAIRRHWIEGFWPVSWENYVKEPLFIFAVPMVLAALWMCGLYRAHRVRSLTSELGEVVKAAGASMIGLIPVLWSVGNDVIGGSEGYGVVEVSSLHMDAGRLQLWSLAILMPTLLMVERAMVRLMLRAMRRRGLNQRHVAVLGTARLGQVTCRTLERNAWTGIHVTCFISHHDRTSRRECLGRPVVGGLDDLETLLETEKLDAVYLAVPTSRASIVPGILGRLERFAIDVKIVPDVPPRHLLAGSSVTVLDGMPILSLRGAPADGLGGFTKRTVDIIGSITALVILSPVLLMVALGVRLSGPGPVIFRQRRVSLGAQQFQILKFRSMEYVEDEPQTTSAHLDEDGMPAAWTRRTDPRITAFGRFIRRTSLDELPQLINVLRGEMSLVGPRPERPELIARFREDWRGYMLRQHVKAGMTGWAQVNGLRGRCSIRKRIQYDLFYVRNWSIWFDLRILWLTVFRGFMHHNAH